MGNIKIRGFTYSKVRNARKIPSNRVCARVGSNISRSCNNIGNVIFYKRNITSKSDRSSPISLANQQRKPRVIVNDRNDTAANVGVTNWNCGY